MARVSLTDDDRVKLGIVIPLFDQLAHTQAMLSSLRATLPAGVEGRQAGRPCSR